MAWGGSRPGAGRKPGASTKLNEEARKKAAEGGLMPLDYMLDILRDETKDAETRFEAAKAAAPYVHARLSSAEVKQETTVRYVARVPDKKADAAAWQEQHAPKQATIQ